MARPRADSIDVDTRERLLASAELEFGRAGFSAARLEDIAREAGISRPSLLYHFGSKDRLYAELVTAAFARLGAVLAEAMDGEDVAFPLRLDALVRRFSSFLASRPGLAPLVLREVLDGRGPGHELLVGHGVPVLDRVEAFVRREGAGLLRKRLPLRPALMQVVSHALTYAASGSLRAPLWGESDQLPTLARTLLLEDPKWNSSRS